eukprot:3672840-Pleurochrysis_carterae.AAC.1
MSKRRTASSSATRMLGTRLGEARLASAEKPDRLRRRLERGRTASYGATRAAHRRARPVGLHPRAHRSVRAKQCQQEHLIAPPQPSASCGQYVSPLAARQELVAMPCVLQVAERSRHRQPESIAAQQVQECSQGSGKYVSVAVSGSLCTCRALSEAAAL